MEDVRRGSLVRFIYPDIFLVYKYLIRMVREGWVQIALVSLCLDISGWIILYQKFLDLNFASKIFLVNKIVFDPKLFGLRVILESTFSGPIFFCLLIPWHQNLAQL